MTYDPPLRQQLQAARSSRTPLATSLASWLEGQRWDIALSLNFAANVSRQLAVQTACTYWQRLDVALFGSNAVQRRKTRLPRACFIEGETGVRNWHYHAAVQLPPADAYRRNPGLPATAPEFADALIGRWLAMQEAGRYSKAEPIYGIAGWLTYISKDAGKGECEFCTATSHIISDSDTM